MKKLCLTGVLFFAIWALPMQADFFLCIGAAQCDGSDNADMLIGDAADNDIIGHAGNDILFGKEGNDLLRGRDDDDILFGGLGSDFMQGNSGNDLLIAGPDDFTAIQGASANSGNDKVIVLVGETVNCFEIQGAGGFDVVHLIGFGPYIVEYPYGQPTPIADQSWVVLQDPIAGGYLFIEAADNGSSDIEKITGFPTPHVTILSNSERVTFQSENCQGFV